MKRRQMIAFDSRLYERFFPFEARLEIRTALHIALLSLAATNMIEPHNKTLRKGTMLGIHCTIRIFSHNDTHKTGYKTAESCQVCSSSSVRHSPCLFNTQIIPSPCSLNLRLDSFPPLLFFCIPNSKCMEINLSQQHGRRRVRN